jgi:hypothetical protein
MGVNFVCVNAGGATTIAPASAGCPGGSASTAGYVAQNSSARYVQAGTDVLSNLGRNALGTPGVNIWNMSILTGTEVTERLGFQFRVDAMNVSNMNGGYNNPSSGKQRTKEMSKGELNDCRIHWDNPEKRRPRWHGPSRGCV